MVVVNFLYPKKNNIFKTAQYSSQIVSNDLPKYSISVYDDSLFKYKRQSKNGSQILSNIISDDFFPKEISSENKTNYIEGVSGASKIFYLKILVNKPIAEDSPGNYSKIFYLAKTQIFGSISTVYYSVRCIEKNQNFTVYTSVISIKKSDFVTQFDGEVFLNLVGDYDVEIQIPIDLQINNSASSSISQVSSAVPQTLSATANYSAYFQTFPVTFDYYEYSDNRDFNYQYINLNLTNSLFSTTNPLIISKLSSGISLRLTFSGSYNISDFNYFGLTITNSDPNYNPNADTIFKLVFTTVENEIISVEECKILSNINSGYYNVIFKLVNIEPNLNNLNYVVIQIISTRTLTQSYTISYLNFINPITVGAFSAKSINNSNEYELFTFDPCNNLLNINQLKNQELIQSNNLFSTVETLLEVKDEIVYEIITQSGEILLPENAMIFTENDFLPVYSINKKTLIFYNKVLEPIKSIKIKPPKILKLIDVYENDNYILNGFCIKNPLFLKNFNRIFLERIDSRKIDNFQINSVKYFLTLTEKYSYFSENILLQEKNNLFEFSPKKKTVEMLLSANSEVLVQGKTKQKIIGTNRKLLIEIDENNFSFYMKSKSEIIIHKVLCKNEI